MSEFDRIEIARYEEVPYDAAPIHQTAPDRLGVAARLAGLQGAPAGRCRVLELGCADGTNLLPLAETWPDSRFVGVDLSPHQIEAGRRAIAELGLANVELRAASLLELGDDLGRFDYILCHGVYSWVPPEVQDGILDVCRRLLAPSGVAYVSYNIFPGWHRKLPLRELMLFAARDVPSARERVRRARAALDAVVRETTTDDSRWGGLLADEAAALARESDAYLVHEYLAPRNAPVLFHEFVAHAARHSLAYLGDAEAHAAATTISPEVAALLDDAGGDPIRLGQYLDFVRNGTFRRSLLVHQGALPASRPAPEAALAGLRMLARARPVPPRPDLAAGRAQRFRARGGEITTDDRALKSVLWALHRRWPEPLDLAALQAEVAALAGEAPPARGASRDSSAHRDAPDTAALARAVAYLWHCDLVTLCGEVPAFAAAPGPRPRASALARRCAAAGKPVAGALHEIAALDGFDHLVLPLLDGTRDRDALLGEIAAELPRRGMVPKKDGRPVTDAAQARALVAVSLDESLRHLAASYLLRA